MSDLTNLLILNWKKDEERLGLEGQKEEAIKGGSN